MIRAPSMLYMSRLCGGIKSANNSIVQRMGPLLSDPILAHGVHCALPPCGSIPDSRVRPPSSCHGSAGPASPHGPVNSRTISSASEPLTNVTTIKSRGLCFEDDACFSATHANAARAVGSIASADDPLPCKKNSTTTGSEERLSRRLDGAYTFVSRPATFSVSFTTSIFLLDKSEREKVLLYVCQQCGTLNCPLRWHIATKPSICMLGLSLFSCCDRIPL